jgi:hypothetical protein
MRASESTIVEYTPQKHGFYGELERLVISLTAVGIAFELHAKGIANPYGINQPMVLEGKPEISSLEIQVFPRPLYDRLLNAKENQAEIVRLIKRPINRSPPKHPIQLNNVQLMMARLVGDAFVSYYERHLDAVEDNWGKEREGRWPAVWWFAWAIRNAISHDGKIRFKNPKHPAVQWRGLKYDFNDNGRRILFDDLTGVELILLMEEMDAELRRPHPVDPAPPNPQV